MNALDHDVRNQDISDGANAWVTLLECTARLRARRGSTFAWLISCERPDILGLPCSLLRTPPDRDSCCIRSVNKRFPACLSRLFAISTRVSQKNADNSYTRHATAWNETSLNNRKRKKYLNQLRASLTIIITSPIMGVVLQSRPCCRSFSSRPGHLELTCLGTVLACINWFDP